MVVCEGLIMRMRWCVFGKWVRVLAVDVTARVAACVCVCVRGVVREEGGVGRDV